MSNSIQILGPRGNTLAVHAAGHGETLFLLHGFPLDYRMWTHQLAELSDRFHVVAVHLRGSGKSTSIDADFTLAELAQDVEFLRYHLAGDEPIWLAGLSMGGYVAFEYWRQFPTRLRGLILSNTKPTADSDEARAGRLKMAELALQAGTWEAVKPMFEKLLANRTVASNASVVELVQSMMREFPAETVAAAQRAMAGRRDFSSQLSAIRVPTLVLAGQEDPIAPAADAQQWARLIPGARFEVVAQSGHLSPLESPTQYNQTLLQFLTA